MVSRDEITSELLEQPRAQANESREALDATLSNERLAHSIYALQRYAHFESDNELYKKPLTANTGISENIDKRRHNHLATSDRYG